MIAESIETSKIITLSLNPVNMQTCKIPHINHNPNKVMTRNFIHTSNDRLMISLDGSIEICKDIPNCFGCIT